MEILSQILKKMRRKNRGATTVTRRRIEITLERESVWVRGPAPEPVEAASEPGVNAATPLNLKAKSEGT